MSQQDRWHTPGTRQQGYVERWQHPPQARRRMVTHTACWSINTVISKRTQALVSGQQNDLKQVTDFTISWMT